MPPSICAPVGPARKCYALVGVLMPLSISATI
jgi:hypothetical protein